MEAICSFLLVPERHERCTSKAYEASSAMTRMEKSSDDTWPLDVISVEMFCIDLTVPRRFSIAYIAQTHEHT